jgi:hypothetical protein
MKIRNIVLIILTCVILAGLFQGIAPKTTEWFDGSILTLIQENILISVGVAVIIILVLVKIFSPNKSKGKSSSSWSVGGSIETIVGSAGVAVIFAVVAFGALFAIVIVAGIADAVTDGKVQQTIDSTVAVVRGEPLPKRAYSGEQCDFKDKLEARNNRLSNQWIAATICKDDTQFMVFVPTGTEPQIEYRNTDDRVLTSRPVTDFVAIEHTWGLPGGMPNLYRIQVRDGFTAAALDSVTFAIRAES